MGVSPLFFILHPVCRKRSTADITIGFCRTQWVRRGRCDGGRAPGYHATPILRLSIVDFANATTIKFQLGTLLILQMQQKLQIVAMGLISGFSLHIVDFANATISVHDEIRSFDAHTARSACTLLILQMQLHLSAHDAVLYDGQRFQLAHCLILQMQPSCGCCIALHCVVLF